MTNKKQFRPAAKANAAPASDPRLRSSGSSAGRSSPHSEDRKGKESHGPGEDRKGNRGPGGGSPSPGIPAVGATISRRAADRIRGGHVWVYASDVETIAAPRGGDLVSLLLPVVDNRGLLLGTALYSPSSQIALRMISREDIGELEWLRLLEARLRRSIERRIRLLKQPGTDSCRLVFSEADELPGLIADKYGDLVILQLLAKGLDSSAVRQLSVRVLRETLA